MSGPDFDNNMRDKFREFDLEPSPAVWQEIESRLKKDRRRKVIVYWRMAAAAALLSLVSWWLYNNAETISFRNSDQARVSETASNKPVKLIENKNESTTGLATQKNTTITNEINTEGTKQGTLSEEDIAKNGGITTQSKKENEIKYHTGKSQLAKKGAEVVIGKQTTVKNQGANKTLDFLSKSKYNDSRSVANANVIEEASLEPSMVGYPDKNSYSINIEQPHTLRGAALLKDSLLMAEVIVTKAKKKWHPAVDMMGGGSFMQEGFLQQYNAVANEYSFDNSRVPGALAAYQHRPSAVQPGLAYTIGSSVNKSISRKTVVGVGLQYNYLSSNIEVGNKVERPVTIYNSRTEETNTDKAYYAVGENGNNYTNKYSYLQVPLSLSWNIDNMKKFWLTGGVTLGYLIYTNALQYNSFTGIYYADNDNLEKFQSGLFGGFQYQVNTKKNPGITIGPEFHYNLGSIEKNKDKKQFMYAGLTANVRFKK